MSGPRFEEIVWDANEARLDVGTRVKLWDPTLSESGVVVEISECDDAGPDDEGRSIPIHPRVYVHWDGEPEREAAKHGSDLHSSGWSTSYDGEEREGLDDEGAPTVVRANFICDELVAL